MKFITQIPCHNEEEAVPVTLRKLPKEIEGIDEVETLIINVGLADSTVEVAKKEGAQHI